MSDHASHEQSNVGALMLGAIGVVFGDIGTSPLYAIKETFGGAHPMPIDHAHVLGVLSLIFWAITLIVSVKYVIFIMRADNRGEGGSLALLALVTKAGESRPWLLPIISALGIFAAALFYGDSMITPAISVLSAVEGLKVVDERFDSLVLPLSATILVVLFMVQRRGTAAMGGYFGPVMMAWFLVLAVLGIKGIVQKPQVLMALSPHYAVAFLIKGKAIAFLALGSVVLAVTGAEALYADMGHFGRLPIRLAWYILVLPALLLNYFGQGALLLVDPGAVENPLFSLAPQWSKWPLLALATAATVIASQAVISGAFSVTRQAIQLGYMPRMTITHTSAAEAGQIYIPVLNWFLMVFVLILVLGFQSSSNLASAYGVAVTGTMTIDTLLIALVMLFLWGWRKRRIAILAGVFLIVDLAFFLANAAKIPHGGWFPLAIGLAVYLLLTTWKRGREALFSRRRHEALTMADLFNSVSERVVRVPGTAVFLTGAHEDVPASLLHNLKHNKVLHQRVVALTVVIETVPFVAAEKRIQSTDYGNDIRRINLHFGFMEDPDITKTLANAKIKDLGFFYEPFSTIYFLSRVTIVPSKTSIMPLWRRVLFAWMVRSATSAMEFFHIPTDQVVELGTQIRI